jgi:small multidrug resistance pump
MPLSSHVSWLLLLLGIALEVVGTTCLKLSNGLSRPWPSVLMFLFYGLSLTTLALAFRDLDIGVAYTVWSALGIAVIAVVGIFWFGEPATASRVFWLFFIVCGVIGLRAASLPGAR